MEYSFSSYFSLFSTYLKLFLLAMISTLLKTLKYPHLNRKSQKYKLPPAPKPWPIVGNLPEMLSSKQPAYKWIHQLMKNLSTEIACVQLGNVHVISVTNPTIACEFLKKHDDVFASRPISMSSGVISGGYLTTALVPMGEQWRKMKKMISKELLSPTRHRWLQGKRMEEADNLVRYVYAQCTNNNQEGGFVNVRIATQQFCGNVIRKMFFNKRYFGEGGKHGGPGKEEIEHVESMFIFLRYLFAFRASDFMPCLRVIDLLNGHDDEKKVKEAMRTVNKYHDPIIQHRIKQWKDGMKSEVEDLLDVMISLKDANDNSLLTSDEIKAQITELMIASIDNPSNAVEWALAEMINQPELLERATEEVDKVVGNNRFVHESDVPNLNFIKACLREALRLHPVAPFNVPRVSLSDAVVCNYFIPKGSHVLLSRQGLGCNPTYWKDHPKVFKPQRHMNARGSDARVAVSLREPDLGFVSFTTGKRACPGVALGTSMTVMMLARLLHGFSWSAPREGTLIELAESHSDLSLAHPLVVIAKPRLPPHLYFLD